MGSTKLDPGFWIPYNGFRIPFTSGDSSLSQKRRDFKSRDFTIILLFVILKLTRLSKQVYGRFVNEFSGSKSSRNSREMEPWPDKEASMETFNFFHLARNYETRRDTQTFSTTKVQQESINTRSCQICTIT